MNIDFVSIPEQTFSMGSSDLEIIDCTNQWASRLLDSRYSEEVFRSWLYKEFPSHSVTLRNFFIGKYPITNAQYKKFVMATGGRAPESFQTFGQDDHPVWGVELDEARGFADWASACLGRDIRLPTEAEWELAARGPLRTEYPYGNEFDLTKANTFETGIGKTTSVKAYEAWASGFRE